MSEILRLSKIMAERGLCSRREADEWISKGWVKVDGRVVAELGVKFSRDIEIELSAGARSDLKQKKTILLNKPSGFVSGQAIDGYQPAVRLITGENHWPKPLRRVDFITKTLAPAGRLDIDSTGLLILSQDGAFVRRVISPRSEIEKEYLVQVTGHVTEAKLKLLRCGLSLDGRRLKPAYIEALPNQNLRFALKEGRKRQIRRMCEAVDLRVERLKRTRIGPLQLGDLPLGCWRFLTDQERALICK